MIIAVDFDGTCVKHAFPCVGDDIPHAARVLKRLTEAGHKIILWTMRSDNMEMTWDSDVSGQKLGNPLQAAIGWFELHGIPLFGVNHNPEQDAWTQSPKAYAELYIDDAALGCPLLPRKEGERAQVDWLTIERELFAKRILIGDSIAKEDCQTFTISFADCEDGSAMFAVSGNIDTKEESTNKMTVARFLAKETTEYMENRLKQSAYRLPEATPEQKAYGKACAAACVEACTEDCAETCTETCEEPDA